MTTPAQDANVQEVAKLDAEIQVGTVKVSDEEEPDPRVLYPLLRKTIESYAAMVFGSGVYKVSFALDPMWVAKVTVDAYGDIATNVDPDDPEEGSATLDPEHLGRFELIGDNAASVGFAVDNLCKTVQALLFDEIHKRETALEGLKQTLAVMAP